MKRLRTLLALGLMALAITGCAFSVGEVSYGFLRKSKAEPPPPPAPLYYPYPYAYAPAPVPTCDQRGTRSCADFLTEAWVCAGDATDAEIVEALRRAGVVRDEALTLIARQRLKGCADAPRANGGE